MRMHCTNSLSHEHISYSRGTYIFWHKQYPNTSTFYPAHKGCAQNWNRTNQDKKPQCVLRTETTRIKTISPCACLELNPHESRQEARSKEAKRGGPLIFRLPRTNCWQIRPYILPGSGVLRGFACVRTKVLTPSVLYKEWGLFRSTRGCRASKSLFETSGRKSLRENHETWVGETLAEA